MKEPTGNKVRWWNALICGIVASIGIWGLVEIEHELARMGVDGKAAITISVCITAIVAGLAGFRLPQILGKRLVMKVEDDKTEGFK